ncbi:unnamed protein product [Hermetia illucens]|uniref:BLOC-1-related complex subunit 8 homolog n=1 Tax=Hermetia illucens TaxID=343691 RepID=A0A7R8YMW0_HERIL|nr:BLOC-1-related complex subunit 8 homolog [Hermetia illucens]XP_037905724.1 BLOC-1-related complex subunit 8 homolog [Hermetia illucens]CAD7078933.1 unnamed protein product [Hermetia illucens]
MGEHPELYLKVRKTTEKISENMHIVANEPSMALYRIQEHVRKVLPPIVDKRAEVIQLQNDLKGHCYDMEYAVSAVKSIEKSDETFKNIQELLKNAIFLKQQLKYEESRRVKRDTNQNSVYKRLSAHITLDLPEMPDISGVVRETTSRVEHMMGGSARASGGTGELQRSHTTLH